VPVKPERKSKELRLQSLVNCSKGNDLAVTETTDFIHTLYFVDLKVISFLLGK
jgi:hypothetical protein